MNGKHIGAVVAAMGSDFHLIHVKDSALNTLSVPDRMRGANLCDRLGLKAKAAAFRASLADTFIANLEHLPA